MTPTHKQVFLTAVLVAFAIQPNLTAQTTSRQSDKTSFNESVRPILSNHCFQCHGPDESKRESDLRLDIAGDIDFEAMLTRINSKDPDEVMPPPSVNKKLTAKKIATLTRWTNDGATYEQHWSFRLPTKASVPGDIHPIDFFIDQKLKQAKLERSPQADPAVLIRRLYLDLVGLPPTLEEAQTFIDQPTDANYQKIVDQLLASPHYGERWARKWLDLARYADTNGYEKDRDRSIWPFRDWVIRSLNKDQPFDQFTIEQIAGDMLPDATQDQKIATGFHRNTMLNEEGGIDPLEFRYLAMVDRVATTGTTWLGLTTGCAQCHTHKYDPITHTDYFGMFAYLNNTDEPDFYLQTEAIEAKRVRHQAETQKLIDALASHWPNKPQSNSAASKNKKNSKAAKSWRSLDTAFKQWIVSERKKLATWNTLIPQSMQANVPYLIQESDGVIFASGDTSKHDIYRLKFPAQTGPLSAIRLEALPDDRLPGRGPGMTYYEGRKGDFYLTEFYVKQQDGTRLKIHQAFETATKNAFGSSLARAAEAIDDDIQTGWGIADNIAQRQVAVFNLEKPIPAGESFEIEMHFGRHFASSLGKFRLSAANSQFPLKATSLDETTAHQLALPTAEKITNVKQAFLLQAPELKKQAADIKRRLRSLPGTRTLIMSERPSNQQRKTFRHHRGEYTQPKEEVTARLPEAVFNRTDSLPKNRLEFANWLVSKKNPLTARVVVNRQWAAFFGTGLVSTIDDFGMQGASPSHPKLLDFLAVEFMERGWSMKQIHRMIVTSKTYRQSSTMTDTSPSSTRLIHRFPRRRLEAEIIRDASLSAAGLLEKKMFGPPVRPPQPSDAAANYSRSKWKASSGSARFRRSIYTYQKRTAPFAMFTTFDATSGESCVAKRDISNTPLQALTMMNDPMFEEIAVAFGKRIDEVDGELSVKIKQAVRWVVTRNPTADEYKMIADFYQKHRDWTAVARVLLCLDEAINVN